MGFATVLAAVALVLGPPAPTGGATAAPGRDDTATLQAQLDAGGTVFLPALPNGQCYATHGLWVSLDGTSIVSDGACIVALGPGPVRLHSPDGDPIPADAVFFVNRSRDVNAAPHGVTIAGGRLTGNRIEGNAGPGILLALPPAPATAPSVDISGNRITGNGLKTTPPVLGGIVAPAGQPGLTIGGNVIGQNGGPDLVR